MWNLIKALIFAQFQIPLVSNVIEMHEGIEEKHSKNALRFFLTLGVAVQSSVNIVMRKII